MPAPRPLKFRRRAVDLVRENAASIAQIGMDPGRPAGRARGTGWPAADGDEGRKEGLTSGERGECHAAPGWAAAGDPDPAAARAGKARWDLTADASTVNTRWWREDRAPPGALDSSGPAAFLVPVS